MLPEVLRLRCASLFRDARSNLRPPRLNQRGPGKGKHSEPVHNPMPFLHCARGVHCVHSVLIAGVHRKYKKCAQCAQCPPESDCFDIAALRLLFCALSDILAKSGAHY